MNKKKIFIILAVVAVVYTVLQVIPYNNDSPSKFAVEDGKRPLVIAHGGAKLLYPENTVYAFDSAFEMGVDVLEMDLCLTKDNVLVTHHNLTVDATSNYTGQVIDYSFEELKSMNFGYKFVDLEGNTPFKDETDLEVLQSLTPMSVEEMFEKYGKDTLYIMEIKNKGEAGMIAADILNDHIQQYNLQEYVVVASFDKEVLEYFVSIKDPETEVSMDFGTATDFIITNLLGVGLFRQFDEHGLQLPIEMYGIDLSNSYIIHKVKLNNKFLHYWTINDPEEIEMLLKKGADGIITDRPDLMFDILEDMGYDISK